MVADFNKKEKGKFINNQLLFKVAGVLFILFILFMIFQDIRIYQKKRNLDAEISIYKKQIEDIKNSSENLRNEIVNSNSVDYLEKLGYEQFGQTRPGETEYMFVNSPKLAEVNLKKDNLGGISSWFGWLTGIFSWFESKD
ncbi:MAG: septum formation initiator family protein [Candidatus Staskawiczbacteria bacterium]|jgi:cell division protein FtsB